MEDATSESNLKEMVSEKVEELIFETHRPYFCWFCIAVCTVVMLAEVGVNGGVQPFSCPAFGPAGLPVYEDGSPCEANIMLGPRIAVLDAMGAKNDVAIFEDGEWHRLLSCSWLHSGFFHLLLNVSGLYSLGIPLETVFGFWRTAVLYIASGVFGTMVSTIFLPGVLSVGASASVFGLIGAYWADILLNYCARCDLEDTGWKGLLIGSAINLLIGFTPWVDNFMHLGGLVAGLVIGSGLFAQRAQRDPHTGRLARTWGQDLVVLIATALLLVLAAGAVGAVLSTELQALLRTCPFCEHINCFPLDKYLGVSWWSCCGMHLQGSCADIMPPANASAPITATCNMTHAPAPYTAQCSPAEDANCVYPSDMGESDPRLAQLCSLICSGCSPG